MFRRVLALAISLLLIVPAFSLAEETQAVEGPVLVSQLPLDAVLEGTEVTDAGYTERLTTSDGMANIVLLRRDGEIAADALLTELYPDAADVTEAEQAPIAAYPASRYTFTLGANEDTRMGTFVSFPTDAYTFAFAVDVWADAEDYDDLISWWIEALDVFDDSETAVPTGLVLTADIPADAEVLGVALFDDGGYQENYLVSGVAEITMTRREEDVSAEDLIAELYPDAQIVSEEEATPVAAYPATRVNFSYGENEDARFGSLILFSTDTELFAFAATAPYDEWDGDYSETVQIWIDSLALIEQ